MFAFLKSVGTLWGIAKVGGIAAAGTYFYSKSFGEEGEFAKTIDKTVIPVVTDVGGKILDGVVKTATGISANDAAKDAVKGAAELTNTGLQAAGGVVQQLPEAASAAGQTVGEGAAAAKSTLTNFLKGIVPKGWEGFATTAALILGGGAVASTGVLGSTAQNAVTKLGGAVMNLPMTIMGGAVQLLTPFAYIGAALTLGWLVLHPNGRQLMSDAYETVKGLFTGGKSPEKEHQHHHAPVPQQQPVQEIQKPGESQMMPSQVKIDPKLMNGIQGGEDTSVIARSNEPVMASRRGDQKTPTTLMGA